jgi:hypothetical protein
MIKIKIFLEEHTKKSNKIYNKLENLLYNTNNTYVKYYNICNDSDKKELKKSGINGVPSIVIEHKDKQVLLYPIPCNSEILKVLSKFK